MNRIYLQGWVEQEPEVQYFGYEHVHSTFRLRTEESLPSDNDPDRIIKLWHRISAWGAIAKQIEAQVHVGQEVRLTGRLTYDKQTDRDGITRTIAEVDCLHIEVMASPSTTAQQVQVVPQPSTTIDWASLAPTEGEDPMA